MIERIEAIDAWIRGWARRYHYDDGEDAYHNVLERLVVRSRDGSLSLPEFDEDLKGYLINAIKRAVGNVIRLDMREDQYLRHLYDGDVVPNHPRPTCPKGHVMTPENSFTVAGKQGKGRGCRTCRNATVRRRYHEKTPRT